VQDCGFTDKNFNHMRPSMARVMARVWAIQAALPLVVWVDEGRPWCQRCVSAGFWADADVGVPRRA
jgi:hypothetical protein